MPSNVLLTPTRIGRAVSALALLNCQPRMLRKIPRNLNMHQLLMVLLRAENSEEELDDEKPEGLALKTEHWASRSARWQCLSLRSLNGGIRGVPTSSDEFKKNTPSEGK
ncbi:hypothetical protein B0H13DRAFT_1868038 [Mycena leptocephala]|nr:hypothetical protein B0H13DRAFT_1868038 [Mycena leptocephala]